MVDNTNPTLRGRAQSCNVVSGQTLFHHQEWACDRKARWDNQPYLDQAREWNTTSISSKNMETEMKHACKCCRKMTIELRDSFEVCPVCFWEDDPLQSEDEDYSGGANEISLKEARANYSKFGAMSVDHLPNVLYRPRQR